MIKHHLPATLLLVLVGCGGPSIPENLATPHGGSLVALPKDQGYVEIVKRIDPSQAGRMQVVLYFLDGARKPMEPAPDSARLKIPGARGKTLDLAPAADSSLESTAIDDPGELNGTLSAKLGDEEISVAIRAR